LVTSHANRYSVVAKASSRSSAFGSSSVIIFARPTFGNYVQPGSGVFNFKEYILLLEIVLRAEGNMLRIRRVRPFWCGGAVSYQLSVFWAKYGQFDRARSGSSARLPAPIEE
jgi:hypothetical protein